MAAKDEAPASPPSPPPAPEPVAENIEDVPPEIMESLSTEWEALSSRLAQAMPLARMYLKQSAITGQGAGKVRVGLHPRHEAAIAKLEQDTVRQPLQEMLEKFSGHAVRLSFEVLDEVPEEPEQESEETAPVEALPPEQRKGLRDWHDDPVVRRTLEIFHGDIIDVSKE